MVPVSEFLPTLRLLVDVPVPGLMETALAKAAQRFCRESKVIIKTRQLEEVFSCQHVSVIGNQFDNYGKLCLKGAGLLSAKSEGQDLKNGVDYIVIGLDVLKFTRHFNNVELIALAEPVANATQLPRLLLDDYVDPVCAGAAAILQMMPNAPWSQPELAQVNEREFISGYRDAHRYMIEHTPILTPPRPRKNREFY